jgi:hypothetical protein
MRAFRFYYARAWDTKLGRRRRVDVESFMTTPLTPLTPLTHVVVVVLASTHLATLATAKPSAYTVFPIAALPSPRRKNLLPQWSH